MRVRMLLALTLGVLVSLAGVAARAADDAKKDLAKLEGTWKAASITTDGKELPGDVVKTATLTVKDGSYTYKRGEMTVQGKLELDPSKTPKAVDAVRTEGAAKGTSVKGVYELTDDTFKVCFAAPGKDRPSEAASKAGSGATLTVWKKAK